MNLSLRHRSLAVALFVASGAFADGVFGQCISLTTLNVASTQSFDGLANSGTNVTWTDNSTLPGWYASLATYNAGTGTSTTGAMYSFGVAGTHAVTDRALGSVVTNGTGEIFWAVCFVNNTGATLTSLDLAFVGEQWRDGNPSPAATHSLFFEYQTAASGVIIDANNPTTGWTPAPALDFAGPVAGTAASALDGNLPANRVAKSSSLAVLVSPGNQVWLRFRDANENGSDHGLAIDEFSMTPQGSANPTPTLSINDVTANEGNSGTTSFNFTVSLNLPAPVGGVTFDIATADGTAQDGVPGSEDTDYQASSQSGVTIAEGGTSAPFSVTVNGDAAAESNETFFVNITNVVGASLGDGQGLGTIVSDDFGALKIHDLQGNGSATPIAPATIVQVTGVVTADFQGATQTRGFFLQEEDADADADPATSEGIFVFCNACPTAVAEGQRVQVTGTVAEFFNLTELTASTASSVLVVDAGNHLADVTPSTIDLPVVGVVNDFYETREAMLVQFADSLAVSEYFELARFGQIELFEGGRPRQYTETTAPSVAGYNAHLEALSRRRVILDDDNNTENFSLTATNGQQLIYLPRANGGFSVGTQGTDFFRGGDLVNNLVGVLDWSFAGASGTDAWRIRPAAAHPALFTVANPRPVTPPVVGGAIHAVGMNLLNYFTTIDTTSSTSSGPCGPTGTLDCRGADNVAELNRQRERASIVVCTLNADVYAFAELENTTASASITDLLGAVNVRCGGAHPYAFANTGSTLGSDAIRVQIIYRTGILSPVGSPLVDTDPIHSRPPTAQIFDVVDATNAAFGQRFTVIANHFKSKGSSAGLPGDADAGDGAGASNATRTAQASRLLTWISNTVVPAAGDPDVLLLGDFNAYGAETPVTTITGGSFTDLESSLLGPAAYSYLFDGQLGHLDYAFSSASLTPQITGVGPWHINADESDLFDYNDETKDTGEAAFEEKPDGSALVPPRVLFQPASPYRASDHDPVLVGLFAAVATSADLSLANADTPDPVIAGNNLTYTLTAQNLGPNSATTAAVADTLPAGTTFVSLASPGGWSCTTPSVGGTGSVSCTNASFAVGSAVFTLVVKVAPSVTSGTVISNPASTSSSTADPSAGNNDSTALTDVVTSANLSITKTDGATTEIPGTPVTYTLVAANAGPSNATAATVSDNFPVLLTGCSTTCVSAGGATCSAGPVSGPLNDSASLPAGGSATYTAVCTVSAAASGSLANTATVSSATPDPASANNSATDTDTLLSSTIFIDGFASSDTSQWSATVPLSFEVVAIRTLAAGANAQDFAFDFESTLRRAGETPDGVLAARPIASVLDRYGHLLCTIELRRSGAGAPLELCLEVQGARSAWTPVDAASRNLRVEWSSATGGSLGSVALALDGSAAIWVEGFAPAESPAEVRLFGSPAARP
ncbi:MAG: ExeM/NucH family extracellular endonuclease [Thermoanaerobaculia bacterium]